MDTLLSTRSPFGRFLRGSIAIAIARLRFMLLVGGLLSLIAAWPLFRNTFDKLTTTAPVGGPISSGTEYWCPMCPGVLSDWPAKCPVCSMTLVRRQKGEMTPLPDGVVARVQLSPYRIQLAGLRTAPVEYRKLETEVDCGGLLDSAMVIAVDVFEPDSSSLSIGQMGRVIVDGFSDERVEATIIEIAPAAIPTAGKRVRIQVQNPRNELRPDLYARAIFLTPVAALESSRRSEANCWNEQVALALFARRDFAIGSLAEMALRQSAAVHGLTLCVPESAVIDTGARRVVYLETMPGVFDAVEIRVGRRCGNFYPVRAGLESGRRVVIAGAVLLDAETRLNPSVAASYFGAGGRPSTAARAAGSTTDDSTMLIAKQKICPVTGEPLGSMGAPVRVSVGGKPVYVCCKSCEKPLLRKPDEYLSKLPK